MCYATSVVFKIFIDVWKSINSSSYRPLTGVAEAERLRIFLLLLRSLIISRLSPQNATIIGIILFTWEISGDD